MGCSTWGQILIEPINYLMQVQAHALARRCCAKDSHDRNTVNSSSLKARERDIEPRYRRCKIVVQRHYTYAEEPINGVRAVVLLHADQINFTLTLWRAEVPAHQAQVHFRIIVRVQFAACCCGASLSTA